jgi:hypothetical protein
VNAVLDAVKPARSPLATPTVADERAARRTLARQIERLERDLARLRAAAWPRTDLRFDVGSAGARPRLRDLGELERIRDALAARLSEGRRELAARHAAEAANRQHVAAMLRHPERHRWERISNADIGEPGCHHWHVVPRLGPIGMFANWWRVKISSGCPLAT